MTDLPTHILRLADLPNRKATRITLTPDAPAAAALAEVLGIEALRKARFDAVLAPSGRSDWHLTGTLGATVEQVCVVTLDPVVTRIEEQIERRYLADMETPEGSEVEMPEDDSAEALPATLDLYSVMIEALALALPAYPRSDAAPLDEMVVTEPGAQPLTRDQMKPFAGLAGLKAALEQKSDDDT